MVSSGLCLVSAWLDSANSFTALHVPRRPLRNYIGPAGAGWPA